MHLFLAIIPALAFTCLLVFLKNLHTEDQTRRLTLQVAILWSCYLVLSIEILSIFRAITLPGLVIMWSLPILAFLAWFGYKKSSGDKVRWPGFQLPTSWWNKFLLILICGVLLLTAVVAWVTPPQTWDALSYHLSRVAHWAQNRSVWHYATGIDRQTSMTPGAEMITLNIYILTQSDRLANFTQWFAMLGSIIGASLIAGYLGAKSTTEWLAAIFTASIPMGIVEASSSITDYVTAFWVVCVVVETLVYYRTSEKRCLMYISLAAGLAILTKPIAIPYLIPFAAWIAYLLVKRNGFLSLLKWSVIAILTIGILNGGYLAQNYVTYGAPSNPVDFQIHYNQLHSIQGFIATVLKNAGMNMGLPNLPGYNHEIFRFILKVVVKLGLDINDPRMSSVGYFQVSPPSTSEDLVSNPYHAYIFFGSFLLMSFTHKKQGWLVITYGLLVAATFLIFSYLYKWNVFGTRYQLPFFVLFAPAAVVILSKFEKIKLGNLVAILLVISCYPWVFQIASRPLIPDPGSALVQGSILNESRLNLYFANAPGERDDYVLFTEGIKSSACSDVGILLEGEDPEYLLWVLMGAPRRSLQIEWLVSGATARYAHADFKPCAVICHGCESGQVNIPGLELAIYTHDMWLYLPTR